MLIKSKTVAWIAMLLVVVDIVVTFRLRTVWWAFTDEFFAFMMVFCGICSLYTKKLSPSASGKLNTAAWICGGLMILAIIAEFIAFQF